MSNNAIQQIFDHKLARDDSTELFLLNDKLKFNEYARKTTTFNFN